MNPMIERLREQRDALEATVNGTLERAAAEDRDLTDVEDKNLADAIERMGKLDERLAQLADVEDRNAKAAELVAKVDGLTRGDRKPGIVRVGNEPLTYHEHASHGFFADLALARTGDQDAAARLNRHRQEMVIERAADTLSSTSDFTPPKYLMDKYVDVAYAGRPVANLIGNSGAPTAEVFKIPRYTGTATVARQTAENTTLATFNRSSDSVTLNTQTLGAYYDASLQMLEFSPVAQDDLIFRSMNSAMNVEVESMILGADLTGFKGLVNVDGKHDIDFTDASPTFAELYAKIGAADAAIAQSRKLPGQVAVVSHALWAWMSTQVDTTGRPLLAPVGPQNAPGTIGARVVEGTAGYVYQYLVVRADVPQAEAATPTNEQLVVFRPDDCVLFESAPSFRVFEDAGSASLTVRFRIHKFIAFSAELWPGSVAVVAGSGTNV